MLTNLPAFSGQMVVAFLLADVLILALFAVAAGPLFVFGRDMFGRPVEVSLRGKLVATGLLFVFLGYFALQTLLVARFLPYEFDQGVAASEVITAHQVVDDPAATEDTYWIVTANHRFGVTREVYDALSVGDLVRFHFRPSDDTLFSAEVIHYANEMSPAPGDHNGPSPAP